MNNIITDYLTYKVACDIFFISTTLAIREVLSTKCRYLGRKLIFVYTAHAEVSDYDYKDIDGLKISKTIKYKVKVR